MAKAQAKAKTKAKQKIILDVDTGSDDAMAIMAAILSPDLDLLGLTTVNGNKPVDNTTENTLRVVDLLKAKVPVYRGCEEPMVAALMPGRQANRTAEDVAVVNGKKITYHPPHLEELPPSRSKPQAMSAVSFLIDTLMKSDGDIVVIAVAPLTNLGVALRAEPRLKKKIKRFVIMGGGRLQTNVTSAAEFNIWKDPEAAQIVFTSGVPILLVPLDATHRGYMGREESDHFRRMGNAAGTAMADLLDTRIAAYDALQPVDCAPAGTTPPHDALAVCSAIDETVLRDVRHMRVDVDFGGGISDGMTVCDPRVKEFQPKNVHIALDVDRDKFVAMMYDIIARHKG